MSQGRGGAGPLFARIKGTNPEVSEEKAMSDHGLFSSEEGKQGAANGQDSWGVFQGYTGHWTA